MTFQPNRVLVVTKDAKISSLIQFFLVPPNFELTLVSDFSEARRLFEQKIFDIVIADFCDGEETGFSVDISNSSATILLLAPAQHFDKISLKVEPFGILTAAKPFDNFYLYNMIKIAVAVQNKVRIISSQTLKLKEKMGKTPERCQTKSDAAF